MKARIIPCKFCKRGRMKVHSSNKIGHEVIADKCVYCDGKGYIRIDENGNKIETTKNEKDNSNI